MLSVLGVSVASERVIHALFRYWSCVQSGENNIWKHFFVIRIFAFQVRPSQCTSSFNWNKWSDSSVAVEISLHLFHFSVVKCLKLCGAKSSLQYPCETWKAIHVVSLLPKCGKLLEYKKLYIPQKQANKQQVI